MKRTRSTEFSGSSSDEERARIIACQSVCTPAPPMVEDRREHHASKLPRKTRPLPTSEVSARPTKIGDDQALFQSKIADLLDKYLTSIIDFDSGDGEVRRNDLKNSSKLKNIKMT